MSSNRRWVYCQLEALQHHQVCGESLENCLTRSLDETYERVLRGVEVYRWGKLRTRVVSCNGLTVASRPLHAEEPADAPLPFPTLPPSHLSFLRSSSPQVPRVTSRHRPRPSSATAQPRSWEGNSPLPRPYAPAHHPNPHPQRAGPVGMYGIDDPLALWSTLNMSYITIPVLNHRVYPSFLIVCRFFCP